MTGKPLLWHIPVSHYSEKVRWALDYKRVPHVRRGLALPGAHIPAAMWLTRNPSNVTFPVLELDGDRIGDSTEIIAVLEERFPEPPLYPADPEQRARALALEHFFDEELGPHIRLLVFHELGEDPERFEAVISRTGPPQVARMGAAAVSYARAFTNARFGVRSEDAAQHAREKVLAALDRLEVELEGDDYLLGDTFTVADLTAAALFYPLVLPVGGPVPTDEPAPRGLEEFRAPLQARPGYRWVQATYERHRDPLGASAQA